MADESGLIRNRRYIVWDAEKASLNKLLLLLLLRLSGGTEIYHANISHVIPSPGDPNLGVNDYTAGSSDYWGSVSNRLKVFDSSLLVRNGFCELRLLCSLRRGVEDLLLWRRRAKLPVSSVCYAVCAGGVEVLLLWRRRAKRPVSSVCYAVCAGGWRYFCYDEDGLSFLWVPSVMQFAPGGGGSSVMKKTG
jgi:hypothetical protein